MTYTEFGSNNRGMIRNSVVDGIKTSESSRAIHLRVDIPFFSIEEREKFEEFAKNHGLVKGRFVRMAVLRAMEQYEAKNKEPNQP